MSAPPALRDLPRPLVAVMSSGYFGFFAHAGFLQALEDLGLSPDAYAGCSSGALVAALAAGGRSPASMLEGFAALSPERFWDPPRGAGLAAALAQGFKGRSGYLEGKAMLEALAQALPVASFEQCPKPCLMVALDLEKGRRVVLRQGPLAPAVAASGAVPGLFAAVEIEGRLLVDGGLVDKAPLEAARVHLGAASLLAHVIPSASLEKPLSATLGRAFSPLRVQARGVDAARQQHYQDQLEAVRSHGVRVLEVLARGLPRLGPKRLALGPEAFAQARRQTLAALSQAQAGGGALTPPASSSPR